MNFEENISAWRRQMLDAGIKTPVPLDELEIHLREEIEQRMKSGMEEQKKLLQFQSGKSVNRGHSTANSKKVKGHL